jgi:DNA-binding LacI/PurR family transcriptional regulator
LVYYASVVLIRFLIIGFPLLFTISHVIFSAEASVQQKTFNVGVVVPEFINPFFPEVIIGIQDVLIKKGYQVLIMQSNESYETELMNVKTLEDNMVDGLIISLSRETQNLEYYKSLTIAMGFWEYNSREPKTKKK